MPLYTMRPNGDFARNQFDLFPISIIIHVCCWCVYVVVKPRTQGAPSLVCHCRTPIFELKVPAFHPVDVDEIGSLAAGNRGNRDTFDF